MNITNASGLGNSASLLSNMPEGTEGLISETLGDEVVEDQKQPENQKEELTPQQELLQTLEGEEDAPDEFQLDQWKSQYGRYYASSIHGDDIYIWRTLKRHDYKQLASSGAMDDESIFKDAVVKKCLLYPTADAVYMQKLDAGIAPTLFEQIMYQSGFIPKEMALGMIRRV